VPGSKRRALGQHFLRDAGIARAIVDLVAPTAADLVVEIGPGQGALTQELARRAGRVVALEVDRGLLESLRRRWPAVEVLEADARTWDYGALERAPGGRVLVVGNLPYSVGKPIVAALLEARGALDAMALMLQREVAERLAAPPGGKVYGALSVLTQAVCDVELALRVPPGAFRPPPKVESAVVRLTPRSHARVPPELEARFREVEGVLLRGQGPFEDAELFDRWWRIDGRENYRIWKAFEPIRLEHPLNLFHTLLSRHSYLLHIL